MKTSLYTRMGRAVKAVTGIQDISLLRKNIHRDFGKIFYRKKYTAEDLLALMQTMGLRAGSVVCIHASMKEFYNYQGTAFELIDGLLRIIGPEGTLAMPAFPPYRYLRDPAYIFHPERDKTGAGYLAETFRRYPGVKRSLNAQHAVCAIGKDADYLIKDHLHGEDGWDKKSPWYRLCELNALVFNLGMPRAYIGTFHHCVESLLRCEHPYWAQFFNEVKSYRYYDAQGEIRTYFTRISRLERRTRESKVTRFFTPEDWKIRKISNLEIKVFYSKPCLDKLVALGRKGITVYYVPSPRNYKFG